MEEPKPHPGPLTPEREAELRAKPAHYCVHEVFPALDQLRAQLAAQGEQQGPISPAVARAMARFWTRHAEETEARQDRELLARLAKLKLT